MICVERDGYLVYADADRVEIVPRVQDKPLTPKDWIAMADALCDVALDIMGTHNKEEQKPRRKTQ